MKNLRSELFPGLLLIILAVLTYVVHYLLFHDSHHIFIYLVGDIGFMFLEVLVVTLIIHRVLNEREKQKQLEKLNMVIGAFFSEVGTDVLKTFTENDDGLDQVRHIVSDEGCWSASQVARSRAAVNAVQYGIDINRTDMPELNSFLKEQRKFLLRLLENPTMLEHESFTELLRAVFHLVEELENRDSFEGLPDTDIRHLTGDINRAYNLLVSEWFDYMKHLHDSYPYLFSLAVRLNPFDREASAVVGA